MLVTRAIRSFPQGLHVSCPTANPAFFHSCKMSTSATATKHEWIVILPDQEGALERRMKVRPDHMAALTPRVDQGFWKMGGAILDEPAKGGEGLKIKGSIMLALAETEAEVLQALKEDIYYKSDVWDWGKVQIYPFRSAVRKEL